MIRSHDDTSRALLAAAHRLLAEDGPEALTVRRIANEAGMSTMNVYSRFGGKDVAHLKDIVPVRIQMRCLVWE